MLHLEDKRVFTAHKLVLEEDYFINIVILNLLEVYSQIRRVGPRWKATRLQRSIHAILVIKTTMLECEGVTYEERLEHHKRQPGFGFWLLCYSLIAHTTEIYFSQGLDSARFPCNICIELSGLERPAWSSQFPRGGALGADRSL